MVARLTAIADRLALILRLPALAGFPWRPGPVAVPIVRTERERSALSAGRR
jgi:hypothetical protein